MVREPDSEAQGPASETDVRRRGERREPSTLCKLLLVVANGDLALVRVNHGSSVVFGRKFPSDFSLDSASVSRQHARFTFDDQGLLIEDLDSLNGTRVRGERISSTRLAAGDVVEIGDARLLFFEPATPWVDFEVLTYDELVETLDHESRAGQPMALALFGAPGSDPFASGWFMHLFAALRRDDRVALYGPGALLVLTTPADEDSALELPRAVLGVVKKGVGLRVGVATSRRARSAHELLGLAVQANAEASQQEPLRVAGEASAQDIPACIGSSASMSATIELAKRVAAFDVPVLINGEPGSGMLVVARLIHEQSPRKRKPLVVISGAAPLSQLHEAVARAAGSTLLIDEIGDLAPDAQAALETVLDSKGELRLIATTRQPLELADARGFSPALWQVLRTAAIEVPPLRERQGDVELLSDAFLRELAQRLRIKRGLTENARHCLRRYPWPGNVRQLRNVLERAALVSRAGSIELGDLPRSLQRLSGVPLTLPPPPSDDPERPRKNSLALRERLREFESSLIREALERAQGSRAKAAELLGIPLRTLNHKMKQLGIK